MYVHNTLNKYEPYMIRYMAKQRKFRVTLQTVTDLV